MFQYAPCTLLYTVKIDYLSTLSAQSVDYNNLGLFSEHPCCLHYQQRSNKIVGKTWRPRIRSGYINDYNFLLFTFQRQWMKTVIRFSTIQWKNTTKTKWSNTDFCLQHFLHLKITSVLWPQCAIMKPLRCGFKCVGAAVQGNSGTDQKPRRSRCVDGEQVNWWTVRTGLTEPRTHTRTRHIQYTQPAKCDRHTAIKLCDKSKHKNGSIYALLKK